MPRPRTLRKSHIRPMAGDLVRVTATDDVLIKVGSYGVINGVVGKRKSFYSVTFNYTTPYRDDEIVSASGGPVRGIKASRMKPTGERKTHRFWRFKHDMPTAGGGVERSITVNVFEVDLNA